MAPHGPPDPSLAPLLERLLADGELERAAELLAGLDGAAREAPAFALLALELSFAQGEIDQPELMRRRAALRGEPTPSQPLGAPAGAAPRGEPPPSQPLDAPAGAAPRGEPPPSQPLDAPAGSALPSALPPYLLKSRLSDHAGRYSETPAPRSVWPREEARGSARPPTRGSAQPHEDARGSARPPTRRGARLSPAGGVRLSPAGSGRQSPPAEDRSTAIQRARATGAGPSVFELGEQLDQGRAQDVLDAIGDDRSPAHWLMRCRALLAVGATAEARSELEELAALDELPAELLTSVARLELLHGALERALAHANRAVQQSGGRGASTLVLAWAALRTARRGDVSLLPLAEQALSALGPSPESPALTLALRADLLAQSGESQRAFSAAQRALGLDATSVDALAALTGAAAMLQRADDAALAWQRLADQDPLEAEVLLTVLVDAGISPDAAPQAPTWAPLLDDLELHLAAGELSGLAELESVTRRQLERLTVGGSPDLQLLASLCATHLTTASLFRDFAPYDLSLASIARIDAALLAGYGPGPRPPLPSDASALILALGCYVGEALRQAHRGRWDGDLTSGLDARVIARHGTWEPVRLVDARLTHGASHGLMRALASTLPHPTAPAWKHQLLLAVSPPSPWPGTWPRAAQAPTVARSFRSSLVTSLLSQLGLPLRGQLTDLTALDRYLELIAPAAAEGTQEPNARAAGWVGCYVGELARAELGGHWFDSTDPGAEGLKLELHTGRVVAPLSVLSARLTSDRRFSLYEWYQTLRL